MVSESNMHGETSLDELQTIICRCLYMDIFWIKLKERLDPCQSKENLTMRELFKIMNHSSYVSELPTTCNKRNISSNLKLIKTAAYLNSIKVITFEEIKKAEFAYSLVENMNPGCVFPAIPRILSIGLKYTGKVMSENLIGFWLQKVKDRMVRNDVIMPFEFLYLCINAKDREIAIKKLPVYDRSTHRDCKNLLYTIDNCTKFNPSPDRRIQRTLNQEVQPMLNMMSSTVKKAKVSPKGKSRSTGRIPKDLKRNTVIHEKPIVKEEKNEVSHHFRNLSQTFSGSRDLNDSLNSLKAHVRNRLGSAGLENKRRNLKRRRVFSLVDQSLLEILHKKETGRHKRMSKTLRNVVKLT